MNTATSNDVMMFYSWCDSQQHISGAISNRGTHYSSAQALQMISSGRIRLWSCKPEDVIETNRAFNVTYLCSVSVARRRFINQSLGGRQLQLTFYVSGARNPRWLRSFSWTIEYTTLQSRHVCVSLNWTACSPYGSTTLCNRRSPLQSTICRI